MNCGCPRAKDVEETNEPTQDNEVLGAQQHDYSEQIQSAPEPPQNSGTDKYFLSQGDFVDEKLISNLVPALMQSLLTLINILLIPFNDFNHCCFCPIRIIKPWTSITGLYTSTIILHH